MKKEKLLALLGEMEDEWILEAMQPAPGRRGRAASLDGMERFADEERKARSAAKMEDPTPKEEKNRRFDRLCEVQNRISLEIHQNYIGKTMLVLVDGKDGEQLTARTEGGRLVRMNGGDELIGQFVHAKITGCTTWSLVGELAE